METASSNSPRPKDPGREGQGQQDMTLTEKEATFGGQKGKVTRENTKTEVQSQSLGMGKKTATLYLSRTHTNLKGRNSSVASKLPPVSTLPSRQATGMSEEDELLALVGLRKREFTFTGYDIMEDEAPREDPTPANLEPHDQLKRTYRRTYEDSCKMLGVQPIQPIAGSLADSHVELKTRGLGVKGAKALAISLVDNKTVQRLDLEDNWIGAEGAICIAEMLGTNKVLTEINIGENRIGTKGIRAIAEVMANNVTIRKLDVSGSNLFDHDAKYIAMILENNFKLRELRARHNKFGELGGLYLGPAIANNATLEVLDIAWNHLRSKGAMAVAAGLQENINLKIVDLSFNGFGGGGCRLLGQALRDNTTLKELDLASNRVDWEGVGHIMKGLQSNETLTCIKLGNNPITPDIATVILRAIVESEHSDIRELDLSNVVVEEAFVKLLKETQKQRFITAKTGRVIKKGKEVMKEADGISSFQDPVQALYEFMNEQGYRVIDLFKRFDTDRSMSLTADEFTKGLLSVHVPLTVGQLEDLIAKLDSDGDGSVDLKRLDKLVFGNSLKERSFTEESSPEKD